MKNLSTWILVMFMVMFWIFRMIVALTAELGIDFAGITPIDMTTEVILLFVVMVCLIFIIRRNIIGALIYLLAYGIYFGKALFDNIIAITSGGANIGTGLNAFISLIGIVIPICVLFDLLIDKNRKANPVDKKTDWYYKDDKYDREMDERADKNNYRTL